MPWQGKSLLWGHLQKSAKPQRHGRSTLKSRNRWRHGRLLMSGNSALFPKAPYAAVGTINAAIVALAKAFSDRGITDGVQVNSVLPGPVMTGRRRSYLKHWAPLHNMTVEEATARFPEEAGIARYGEPEEIAELMAFLVSPGARWMTGSTLRTDGGEVKSTPFTGPKSLNRR